MIPSGHYEEAERLLERAAQLTKDWSDKVADSDTPPKKLLNLEILSRMITDRAWGHAALAAASYTAHPGPVEVPIGEPFTARNGVPVTKGEGTLRSSDL